MDSFDGRQQRQSQRNGLSDAAANGANTTKEEEGTYSSEVRRNVGGPERTAGDATHARMCSGLFWLRLTA